MSRVIVIALGLAIVLSVAVHATSPTVGAQYISGQEEFATRWIAEHRNKSVVVFTDFRLAGPLVGSGYLKVIGVSDLDLPPAEVNRILSEIYYSGNPCAAAQGLASVRAYFTNEQYDLLMVSGRMTAAFPGVKGYNRNFAPPPPSFVSTFEMIPTLSEVYDNGQVQVFARSTGSLWTC